MKRMKDGDMTLIGQMAGNTRKRFNLFDGKFTTGFKIKKFMIVDYSPSGAYESVGTLTTDEHTVSAFWDFADVTEVGWTSTNAPTFGHTLTLASGIVRPETIIVEDLFLGIYSTADNRQVNYYIELEKYEFAAWDGAANMVRNNSQGGN